MPVNGLFVIAVVAVVALATVFRDRQRFRNQRSGIVVGPYLLGKNRSANPRWGVLWGAWIALVGVVILLDNLNIFPAAKIYRFWPMILVVIGGLNLVSRSARFFGVILVIAGALFQLSELGLAHFGWGQIWPILLISVGVLVMWSSLEARKHLAAAQAARLSGDATTASQDANAPDLRDTLNEVAVFGGVERRIVTKDFRGGTVNAIFGGVDLDLSHAEIQQPQAELEINAIFGGVELRVPESWQVVSHGQAFFGGYDDKTGGTDLPDGDTPRKRLLITGSVIFGGVDIKS
jgi:predicted membrane protein